MKRSPAINDLLRVMARLRSPAAVPGTASRITCPSAGTAVEEVYELLDAIEAGDDHELEEELGDLLLQVVFHCQLARERGAFDFDRVARHIADKLIRRHPHVFGKLRVKTWTRSGPTGRRSSGLKSTAPATPAPPPWTESPNACPPAPGRHARQEGSQGEVAGRHRQENRRTRRALAVELFALAQLAQEKGWSAEDLLRSETQRRERTLRRFEQHCAGTSSRR